ncbi:MAG: hypothetical protein IKR11_13410 [Solobacterium sp.]|nr:hypothetical protein [Solobacterium sp.]
MIDKSIPNTLPMASDVFEEAKHCIDAKIFATSEEILAEVLKWRVHEFQGMDRKEIVSCIEIKGNPQMEIAYIGQSMTNTIRQESRIFCDIRFTASIPGKPEERLDITAELADLFSADSPLFATGISFMVKRGPGQEVQHASLEQQACDEMSNAFCICIAFNNCVPDMIMKVRTATETIYGKELPLGYLGKMQLFIVYLKTENTSGGELAEMLGELFNNYPYSKGE